MSFRSRFIRPSFFFVLLSFAALFVIFKPHFLSLRVAVQIYYPETNSLFVVPVTRLVPKATPQILFDELRKPPRRSELLPVLAADEGEAKVSTEGSTVVLDFKKLPQFEKHPLMLRALLATFKQLRNFDALRILLNGQANPLLNGEELGIEPLPTFWVNDLGATSPDTPEDRETAKLIIYYVLKNTQDLVPITLRVPANLRPEQAVAAALDEPPPFGWTVRSALPPSSSILTVQRPAKNQVEITVDLTGPSEERRLAESAIIHSCSENLKVRHVRLRVKGRFWEGLFASCKPPRVNWEARRP